MNTNARTPRYIVTATTSTGDATCTLVETDSLQLAKTRAAEWPNSAILDRQTGASVIVEPARVTYAVIVTEPNTWNADGSPIVVRRCGHEHRSIKAAQRCCESLTRPYPDGSRSARWWGAGVAHYDGSKLTEAEKDILYDIAAGQANVGRVRP